MALIECVPNFSEGRDAAVLDAIVAAMTAVPGAFLLGREMDADHNRSVVTLAGEPAAVAEAAVRGVGEAARRIDLRQHRGAHPRVGAADVVPFVPLEGISLEQCARWAEWAGAEIWRRFQVPVYLYEAAARHPDRRQLEAVRRGQFEGLREQVREDPARLPDFGPPFAQAALHPSAGATIVGARPFLIAFNINLDTDRIEVARAIAHAIRESNGGLPALKAMAVRLHDPDRAQVSMNLTNFERTSLAAAWNAVAAEASRHGVKIHESELVGLVPQAALEGAAAELLRLRRFDSERVLENRLAAARHHEALRPGRGLSPWLQALAGDLDPGNWESPPAGQAAAATGALAAALGQRLAGADSPAAAAFAAARTELARALDQPPVPSPGVERSPLAAAEAELAIAVRCRQIESRLRALPPAPGAELPAALALAAAAGHAARAALHHCLADLPAEQHQRFAAELDRLDRWAE